jgi:oligosaccharyltransferase complex subunit alpha (ribophorin I)
MRLTDNHYFYSPYVTETQKATFKLASSSVESFTKLAPFTSKGASIQFGPYENIAPFSVRNPRHFVFYHISTRLMIFLSSPQSSSVAQVSKAVVHSMNNFPFAKFSTMTREVEVSHWGSIAMEEIYELQHAGARLAGGFSRIDYQMMRGATPSFRSLVTTLPAQASGIYYRDQIGNISTSDMKVHSDGEVELELQTRFPIFGGWKTQFYLGYSIPTENALTISGDRYHLKVDFFTAFDNVWVEDMELKVILPEGCEDVKVEAPYQVEQSHTRRFTYLDSELNGGRPVVVLRAKNLVPEHDKQVHITYTFAQKRMVVEPLMLVGTFFAFFCVSILVSRTGAAVKRVRSAGDVKDKAN